MLSSIGNCRIECKFTTASTHLKMQFQVYFFTFPCHVTLSNTNKRTITGMKTTAKSEAPAPAPERIVTKRNKNHSRKGIGMCNNFHTAIPLGLFVDLSLSQWLDMSTE